MKEEFFWFTDHGEDRTMEETGDGLVTMVLHLGMSKQEVRSHWFCI